MNIHSKILFLLLLMGSAALTVGSPVNDAFANASIMTGTNLDLYGASNVDATAETGEPDHAGKPGGHSVWWTWTAPVSGRFALFSDVWMGALPPMNRLLAVYTGDSVSALRVVGSASGRSNIVAKLSFDAVQGTVYHFAVDGEGGVVGSFNLYLRLPPLNDDFADRVVIASTNLTLTATNAHATAEAGEPIHSANGTPPMSVWWRWTAPVAGRVMVRVSTGTQYGQIVAVYTGTDVAHLILVAGSASYEPGYANFNAVAGEDYSIAVDGESSAKSTLVVQYVTAPLNDDFAQSLVVTNTTGGSFFVTGSNLGATKEPGETWWGAGSVWWTWTAPADGEILIELESTTPGTTMTYPWLVVFKGATLPTLSVLSPRTEFAGQLHYHDARFVVTAGTRYYVWVANRGGAEGTYTLRGTFEPPPPNDNFASRLTFTNTPFFFQYGYSRVLAYNASATKETGEPFHGGPNYPYGRKSVWWTWTAPYSGRLFIAVRPQKYTFNSMAALYTGDAVNSLKVITNCFTAGPFGECGMRAGVTAGTVYQIAVDGAGSYGDSGEFALELSGDFDTTAPSVTVTNPQPGTIESPSVIVSGTARDPAGSGAFTLSSGVALVELRLNGGEWLPATGTNDWSLGVTLSPGANLLEVRARDASGNSSDPVTLVLNYGMLISRFEILGGIASVGFVSELGKTYQLERALSLHFPIPWIPVQSEPAPGTGAAMTLTDPEPPFAPARFYRLRVLP